MEILTVILPTAVTDTLHGNILLIKESVYSKDIFKTNVSLKSSMIDSSTEHKSKLALNILQTFPIHKLIPFTIQINILDVIRYAYEFNHLNHNLFTAHIHWYPRHIRLVTRENIPRNR